MAIHATRTMPDGRVAIVFDLTFDRADRSGSRAEPVVRRRVVIRDGRRRGRGPGELGLPPSARTDRMDPEPRYGSTPTRRRPGEGVCHVLEVPERAAEDR